MRQRASIFLNTLPDLDPALSKVPEYVPEFPRETHCAFYSPSADLVTVRKWDEPKGLYNRIDNPKGPALIHRGEPQYFLDGTRLAQEDWRAAVSESAGELNETSAAVFCPRP